MDLGFAHRELLRKPSQKAVQFKKTLAPLIVLEAIHAFMMDLTTGLVIQR
jgi:hypothetical protein